MLMVAVIWYLVVVTALTLVQHRVERHFSKGMSRAAVARRTAERVEATA
jgi:polar amino acid transport system permease protein